jgi:hypothetical protein
LLQVKICIPFLHSFCIFTKNKPFGLYFSADHEEKTMPNADINCRHCQFFKALPQNGDPQWECEKYHKKIEHRDPAWCVCKIWAPASNSFPPDLVEYFSEAAPDLLHHLKSKELYRTTPELELLELS